MKPHQARKRFGQHFLVNQDIIDAIVNAIAPEPGDVMLEIGPGTGALTQALLQRLPRLMAVELDRDLAAQLQQRFAPALQLTVGDALTTALANFCQQPHGLRVVGNLPYNISTPLLLTLLAQREWIRDQHFMLQAEVVQRICASHGHKDYGRISILLQAFYEVSWLFDVPASSFAPPPKVLSAIVRMTPKREPSIASDNLTTLEHITRSAFSQRRKLLRHTLQPWLQQQGLQTDFNFQRRAEQVPAAEYYQLTQTLGQHLAHGAR